MDLFTFGLLLSIAGVIACLVALHDGEGRDRPILAVHSVVFAVGWLLIVVGAPIHARTISKWIIKRHVAGERTAIEQTHSREATPNENVPLLSPAPQLEGLAKTALVIGLFCSALSILGACCRLPSHESSWGT